MSEHKLTQIDAIETMRYSFDEKNKAHRVSISGIDNINVSTDMVKTNELLAQIVDNTTKSSFEPLVITQNQVQVVEVPKIITQEVIKEIEKQVIVTNSEVKIVEIPKIIIQEVIKEVDRPVYLEKIEIHTVEVPSQSSFPQWLKLCMLAQAAAIIGILLVNIFKH